MRLNAVHFLYLFVLSLLGLVEAGPVNGLVRRQDNGPPPSTSSDIPSDSTSSAPPETSTPSTSTTVSNSTSTSSSPSSTVSSGSTLFVSTVSTSSSSVSATSTSTPEPPPPNSAANTPAAFFANRSATLVLGITAGGIACIIVILVLWINFRRAWYFPWNKRKKSNNPNRWSTYSFREKPHLPLGRNLGTTTSTENFAQRGASSNDGHSSNGHGDVDATYGETGNNGMPLPEIRIDSPQSVPRAAFHPPGLEDRSRWSKATTDATMSVYSQQTHSMYDDGRSTSGFVAGERILTRRPSTRATSRSSDTQPFRFDTVYEEDYNQSSSELPLDETTSDVANPPAARLADGDQSRPSEAYRPHLPSELAAQTGSSSTRPGVYFSDTNRETEREKRRDNRYRVSIVERGPSPTETFARMVRSTMDDDERNAVGRSTNPPAATATPKRPPKGILKSPHYLTTSARLATNGRGNVI